MLLTPDVISKVSFADLRYLLGVINRKSGSKHAMTLKKVEIFGIVSKYDFGQLDVAELEPIYARLKLAEPEQFARHEVVAEPEPIQTAENKPTESFDIIASLCQVWSDVVTGNIFANHDEVVAPEVVADEVAPEVVADEVAPEVVAETKPTRATHLTSLLENIPMNELREIDPNITIVGRKKEDAINCIASYIEANPIDFGAYDSSVLFVLINLKTEGLVELSKKLKIKSDGSRLTLIDNIAKNLSNVGRVPTKKAINKRLRDSVWAKCCGDKTIGTCYCCGEPIKNTTFDAGHIVAEANGGPTELANLMAVCHQCNLAMGTMNMEEFKKTSF